MNPILKISILLLSTAPLLSHAAVVAQWHFDEAPGATTALATVGGVDGALAGSAAFVAGGISGNAVSVARAGNGLVNMGDNFRFDTGDFSIVAWVKTAPGYATPDSFIAGKHRATIVAGYFLGINANGPIYGEADKAWFYDANGSPGDDPRSTTSVNDGQWHQVVGVYNAGGRSEIYVDGPGVEDFKAADTMGSNSAAFLIGGIDFAGTPTALMDGLVDEVQLYDHALNACQLQFLFDNPSQVVPADCDGDGVDDVVDNCTLVINPSQHDTNGDGYGNACDPDLNNDGVVNAVDLGLLRLAFFSTGAGIDADFNGDQTVNVLDLGRMKAYFFLAPGPSATAP